MPSLDSHVPAFDAGELKELKNKLVDGCHILDREGITDSFGHVSLRIPGSPAFLTIAGVSPGCATVDRIIMLDFDGRYLGGDRASPYEWPIHARILKARPDVASVCHTHSRWSALFSVIEGGLRPIHMYAKFLPAAGPPIYKGAGLIGTLERGEALAAALQNSSAVLLRGHGDAVVGATLGAAVAHVHHPNSSSEVEEDVSVHIRDRGASSAGRKEGRHLGDAPGDRHLPAGQELSRSGPRHLGGDTSGFGQGTPSLTHRWTPHQSMIVAAMTQVV